jgi:hypothetical protein
LVNIGSWRSSWISPWIPDNGLWHCA